MPRLEDARISLYVVIGFDFTWIHSFLILCKVTTYF